MSTAYKSPPADPRELTIEEIGPHEQLRLKAPPGRITVLTGPNGCGKSHTLAAVDAAQRPGTKLSKRDGAEKGSVTFGGVTIRVGTTGANRRTGDLVVESLEDRLSIDKLVDPGIKDEKSADAERIKSLLLLAGADADLHAFEHLAGGEREEFIALMPEGIDEEKDIVKLADKVKRAFDSAARSVEKNLEETMRERDIKLAAIEGVDLGVPHDESELEHARDTARDTVVRMESERDSWLSQQGRVEEAKRKLDEHEASYDGLTVEEAESALSAFEGGLKTQREIITDIEYRLRVANETLAQLQRERDNAEKDLQNASSHSKLVDEWRETIKSSESDAPSEDAIEEARDAWESAKVACELGTLARNGLRSKRQADELDVRAKELSQESKFYRDAGKGTEKVLSKLVADLGVPLRVDEDFRLQAEHPKRGWCYFSELSMGEKWRIGLDIVISKADGPSLLVIPQEAFESLDGSNRKAISDQIEGTELAILTAQAMQHQGCPQCGELNEIASDKCWNCGSGQPEPTMQVEMY